MKQWWSYNLCKTNKIGSTDIAAAINLEYLLSKMFRGNFNGNVELKKRKNPQLEEGGSFGSPELY